MVIHLEINEFQHTGMLEMFETEKETREKLKDINKINIKRENIVNLFIKH